MHHWAAGYNVALRKEDESSNAELIKITKYAQSLEHIIRFKNKEIQRLEYLNKYLIIAQQKRDDMLTHTLEENRKLKEVALRAEKKQVLDKRQKLPTQLTTLTNIKQANFKMVKSSASEADLRAGHRKVQSMHLNPLTRGTTIKAMPKYLIDDKKTQSILKMSNYFLFERIINCYIDEGDAYTMYNESEHVKFLESLAFEEENFIYKLRNWEDALLISVFHSIQDLLKENRLFFDLVVKLKKIIKAAGLMTHSLILHEAMEEIVDQVCACLDCDRATLWLLDEEKEELWSKVAKGSKETIRIPWDKGIVGISQLLYFIS